MVGFVVVGWSPYSILSAHPGKAISELVPLTLAGALLIAPGVFGYLWCAWDFAFTGLSWTFFWPFRARGTGNLRIPEASDVFQFDSRPIR